MPNDTPFVDLPTPPASPSQSEQSADIRGTSYGPTITDDDDARAQAYRDHLLTMSKGHLEILSKLQGSRAAARSLQHKTLPLTAGAPPYIDLP